MRRLCVCLLAASLFAARAAAQAPATLSGMVQDETGNPIARVTVALTSRDAAITRTATTGNDGRFSFPDLPPAADYGLSAARTGFGTFADEHIVIEAGVTRTLTIALRLSVSEQLRVEVPGGAGAALRSTFDEDLTRDLPLLDRGFMYLAALAPGFTGRPDYPDPQGQPYWTNNVLVDGASNFSKWRGAPRSFYSGYGRESIRGVTVFSSLFPADLGGALASVTTATTRAGSEAWHGSALLFARHSRLAAQPRFARDRPEGATQQFGSSLGGPLSERTFLFVSYDGRRSRDHHVVGSPAAAGDTVPADQDEHIGFARLDLGVSATQMITARVNTQRFRWHDEPGALTLPGTGTSYSDDAHTALVTHGAQLGASGVHELRVEFSRYVDMRQDLRPGVYVWRSGYSIEGATFGPAGFGVKPEDTWEVHEAISHDAGRHALHLGGAVSVVRSHAVANRYASGAYFFAGAPDVAPTPYLFIQAVATSADAATVDAEDRGAALFVHDDWRVRPQVTISAGLRYDIEQIVNVRGFTARTDRDNLQPRIALAWKPGGGATTIRAAAGIYTQQHVLYPIGQVQSQGDGGMATVILPKGSAAFPMFPSVLPADAALRAASRDIVRVGPELRNPYALQAGAGVERTWRGVTLSADYLHLRGTDLISIVDANAPASIAKPAQRTVAEADATRPLPPESGYRKLLTLGNEGRSWYRAVQVKASGGAATLRMLASYTFAHADDQANNVLPEDSGNLAAEKGRAATDVRHRATGALTWQLPGDRAWTRGWSVAAITVLRSGLPYTITWGDDRNGTTQNDARPGGRNTQDAAAYRDIDLSVSRHATVHRVSIETRLELFNLTNRTNYDEYVGALLSPLFGRPISAFPPRRAQLGAVLRF